MKVSSTTIGAFVVGTLLFIVAAAVFFSEGRLFSDKVRYVMFFDTSIQGLQLGAPVKLKGVTIGEVVGISAYYDPSDLSIVNAIYMDIDATHISRDDEIRATLEDLIDAGMRAQLKTQSFLTGLLYVEVDFHPDAELVYKGLDPRYVEIPTALTSLEELSRNLEQIDFKAIAQNIEDISAAVNKFVGDDEFQQLAGNLNSALASVDRLAATLEQSVARLTPEADASLAEVRRLASALSDAVPGATQDLKTAVAQIEAMVRNMNVAVADISYSVSDDSPFFHELTRAAEEVRRAATAVQVLATTLEARPESLVRGK
jgi:paraquat-inducible protein B